jgi:hypothetical protein
MPFPSLSWHSSACSLKKMPTLPAFGNPEDQHETGKEIIVHTDFSLDFSLSAIDYVTTKYRFLNFARQYRALNSDKVPDTHLSAA